MDVISSICSRMSMVIMSVLQWQRGPIHTHYRFTHLVKDKRCKKIYIKMMEVSSSHSPWCTGRVVIVVFGIDRIIVWSSCNLKIKMLWCYNWVDVFSSYVCFLFVHVTICKLVCAVSFAFTWQLSYNHIVFQLEVKSAA